VAAAGGITILLFYQYVKPQWSEQRATAAVAFVEATGAKLNLGGRVRVACEVSAPCRKAHRVWPLPCGDGRISHMPPSVEPDTGNALLHNNTYLSLILLLGAPLNRG